MGEAMDLDISAAGPGILYAVGMGPGDPELMTLKAMRVLEACPVIAAVRSEGGRPRRRGAGPAAAVAADLNRVVACTEASEAGLLEGRDAADAVGRSRRDSAGAGGDGGRSGAAMALDIAREVVDLTGKCIVELTFAMSRDPEVLCASHAAAAEAVCTELAAGRDVAMPILGDPSIYATFHHIKPLVETAGFRTRVIPGVPSFCAVAATLGANLTPTMGTPLHVLPTGYVDVRGALGLPGTKVFMKAGAPLEELRDALREEGLLDRAGLVQDCGLPTQAVVGSLAELEGEAGPRAAGKDEDRTSRPQLGGYFMTVVVR